MQDKLKKYVDEHRDELELYEPRSYLWEGIDERLQRNRKGIRWQQLAIAASVLLVVTCGAWVFMATRNNTPSPDNNIATESAMAGPEVYFTAVMQLKNTELEKYCQPQPELCREFEKDIETLNDAYHQLKQEYSASADREAILRAMAANLQMQVQLISRQLQIMEAAKQKKEEYKII